MAIYKLNEICSLKKGKGKFYKRHLNTDRDIIGYHYGNLYKHSIIDNWDTYVSNEFYREDNIVNVGELMLIDVSESFDEIGYIVYNNFEPGLIGNHIIHLYDFKNVNSKWLYYYLIKNQKLFRQYSYGDKVASLKISDIENLKIYNMPSEDIQNAIIDIIAPIESAISLLEKIIKTKKSMFHLKETGESLNDYARDTNTGYSYSKNDYVGTGKFKVFTIKNISGSTTFERTNIIRNNVLHCGDTITGMSGTIGTATVITDESQVSNQRTFAFSSDFPVQTALSIELQAQKLVNLSTGAVQRNITKDNILNLSFSPFFSKQYDDSIILELKIKKMLTAILEKTVRLLIK